MKEDRPAHVFDRPRTDHRWLRAFEDLDRGELTRRLVCQNWRMDHRVSAEREEELLAAPAFADEPTGNLWWRQRRRAFQDLICRPSIPDGLGGPRSSYLDPSNSNNAISSRTLPGHEQLVHVASLHGLLERLSTAEHVEAVDLRLRFFDLTGREMPRRPPGAGFDRDAFGREVAAIATALHARGEAAVQGLAGAIAHALGKEEPPWWAGFAHELMPFLKRDDGLGLSRALGLAHLAGGDWLVVWRYEAQVLYEMTAGLGLYRPTAIEADEHAGHFPSPPGYRYGITMTLAETWHGECREVIHPPLKGEAAAVACTGKLLRLGGPALDSYNHLERLRLRHREHLARIHPEPETAHWLERHPSP